MSDSRDDVPSFAELAADPEIAALLDFDPVPRKIDVICRWRVEGSSTPMSRACSAFARPLTDQSVKLL